MTKIGPVSRQLIEYYPSSGQPEHQFYHAVESLVKQHILGDDGRFGHLPPVPTYHNLKHAHGIGGIGKYVLDTSLDMLAINAATNEFSKNNNISLNEFCKKTFKSLSDRINAITHLILSTPSLLETVQNEGRDKSGGTDIYGIENYLLASSLTSTMFPAYSDYHKSLKQIFRENGYDPSLKHMEGNYDLLGYHLTKVLQGDYSIGSYPDELRKGMTSTMLQLGNLGNADGAELNGRYLLESVLPINESFSLE